MKISASSAMRLVRRLRHWRATSAMAGWQHWAKTRARAQKENTMLGRQWEVNEQTVEKWQLEVGGWDEGMSRRLERCDMFCGGVLLLLYSEWWISGRGPFGWHDGHGHRHSDGVKEQVDTSWKNDYFIVMMFTETAHGHVMGFWHEVRALSIETNSRCKIHIERSRSNRL